MTCNPCGDKPKKASKDFTKAVVEINNPERLVLFRKVVVPASMGTKEDFPPSVGKYFNVLLQYETNGDTYLYSSDGIPTQLSSDVSELQRQLETLGIKLDDEIADRIAADNTLTNSVNSLSSALESEITARENADTTLSNRITTLDNSLAPVAKSGSYTDLTNKPTIGNGTLTINRNNTSVGTFRANATTNTSVNIAVPTKTSELTNDGANGTSSYVEASDMPVVDTTYSHSSNNAIANSTVTNSLDRNVMTDLSLDANPSTTTINLNNVKTNLSNPSSSTTTFVPLPVASTTQAGVMNSATFDAVTNNSNNINVLLNGAVAVTGLPASPTQAELTAAWQSETGLTTLINRAGVYDVTNQKVWTYYANDQTWHSASNTSQVTVNTFTNSSEGLIKGSTNDGQVFAENDGTGSVNGWDALNSAVASNTSKLATIAQGAEVNVQADWAQTNTTADDYIKNKPTIPTVNNATLTIQKNGVDVQTFTANSSTNKTANITVPTAVSELTNDADYVTDADLNAGLATKQNLLTAGTNIAINNDVISATDTTYTAGNGITIDSNDNNRIDAAIYPADFFTAPATVSGTGSEIELNGTIPAKLKNVEFQGDTYQQTYSGKNKINLVDSSSSGVTGTNNGDGTITISGTATSGGGLEIMATHELLPAGTYTLTISKALPFLINLAPAAGTSFRIPAGSTSVTTTLSQDYNSAGLYMAMVSGTTYNETFGIQLTSGSTPDYDFEPYVGGIPSPNPDYPQTVQTVTGEQTVEVTGKNLLDVSQGYENAYINSSGNKQNGGGKNALFTYIAVSASTSYTISQNEAQNVDFAYYDSSKNFISVDSTYDVSTTHTITTPSNCAYLRFWIYRGDGWSQATVENMNIQCEKGSSATDYQPYQSQSHIINLGSIELCKIGDYQDYIYKGADGWYVHKETNKVILNGSENWNRSTYSNSNNFYTTKEDAALNPDSESAKIRSDLFRGRTISWSGGNEYYAICLQQTEHQIRIFYPQSLISNVNDFKTWLSSHNVTTYYAMDNAYYTDTKITNADLVAQLEALAGATGYNEKTYLTVTATGTNLPAILGVEAYRKSLAGILEATQNTEGRLSDYITDTELTGILTDYATVSSLATVATSGSYDDLSNKPSIPAVNNATLTIQKNGTNVATFTANSSTNQTANIEVPVITMTTTDPGEGSALATNNFIAVYNAS